MDQYAVFVLSISTMDQAFWEVVTIDIVKADLGVYLGLVQVAQTVSLHTTDLYVWTFTRLNRFEFDLEALFDVSLNNSFQVKHYLGVGLACEVLAKRLAIFALITLHEVTDSDEPIGLIWYVVVSHAVAKPEG